MKLHWPEALRQVLIAELSIAPLYEEGDQLDPIRVEARRAYGRCPGCGTPASTIR